MCYHFSYFLDEVPINTALLIWGLRHVGVVRVDTERDPCQHIAIYTLLARCEYKSIS
jgi:hypothetical protein